MASIGGNDAITERNAAEPFVEVPVASPIHLCGASYGASGVCQSTGTVVTIPVLTPLMDVAAHVKQV